MAGEIGFTMTEADYIAANQDWLRGTIFKRQRFGRIALIALVIFVCGLVLASTDGAPLSEQISYGACLAGAFVGIMALIFALSYLSMPRRAGRLFDQQTAMHKPMTISWSDDGMVHASANGEGRYRWADLYRWSDAKNAILIYQTDQMFHVVPRRSLSAVQVNDLLDTLVKFGPPRF